MKKLFSLFMPTAVLVLAPSLAFAGDLQANDLVGVTFWIISIAMVAATVFFLMERSRVSGKWQTSLSIMSLVTLIAAVHYFYMREVWVDTGTSPTVFRYIDWVLTVPLQMIEFYLILAAVTAVSAGVFWRLLVGTLVMLIAGYAGEAGIINPMLGFIVGMAGWFYILYEIFMGEAGTVSQSVSAAAQSAFSACRMVVLVGWAIYPAGYLFGYLMGGVDAASLNLIYNLADFVNKIAFGVFIWSAAVSDSAQTA
tara:strand:- start:426 stop:1184 length:759 start_codon:yes stop_codon:yes gene_type:complete